MQEFLCVGSGSKAAQDGSVRCPTGSGTRSSPGHVQEETLPYQWPGESEAVVEMTVDLVINGCLVRALKLYFGISEALGGIGKV